MNADRFKALPGFEEKIRPKGKVRRIPDELDDPDEPGKRARVDHVFEVGFPFDTDETAPKVTNDIRKAARDALGGGRVIYVERVDTPELEAAGQCLIRALITGVPADSRGVNGDDDPQMKGTRNGT